MTSQCLDYLRRPLERLDLLLHREILRLRARYSLSLDEFRGLYVSDEQVNRLLSESASETADTASVHDLTIMAATIEESLKRMESIPSPWQRLESEFSLGRFERDVVLLALAPHVDLKYETVIAYLNNDITRKAPTIDLALRVFADDQGSRAKHSEGLLPGAPLLRSGILVETSRAPESHSWLATGFRLRPGIVQFLLGHEVVDPEIAEFSRFYAPSMSWASVRARESERQTLRSLVPLIDGGDPPVVVLEGRYGSAFDDAVAAIGSDCRRSVLYVDGERLVSDQHALANRLKCISLHRRMTGAIVVLDLKGSQSQPSETALAEAVGFLSAEAGRLIVCARFGQPWRQFVEGRHLHVRFEDLAYPERAHLWRQGLAGTNLRASRRDVERVASRFTLTPGQIQDAIALAADRRVLLNGHAESDAALMVESARAQNGADLATLAIKVAASHTWEDLVLPDSTLNRVREVAAAVRHRYVVYTEWGFDRRALSGRGLKALFAGPSGTGKTMTAGVIAADLGLDLYKIDLSTVVSKYIGETERNLEKVFRAADCSNAILFFDEADALFGKRSEVKDAHDRYANIEIAYLLQRMEAYEGFAILATNLNRNIDDAFSRRMHYVVEFPLPDERQRARLWRGMFPPGVPLGPDVDLEFLAKQFALAGGDIMNVALEAAFLAAQNGRLITMKLLVLAMGRQLKKQGRIPSQADFKQYHSLLLSEV